MNNKEIIKNLKSGDSKIILNTLNYVEKEGNVEILGHVIELLYLTSETLIRDEIIKILEFLNEQNCAPVLVDSIKNPKYYDQLSILIPACWKNGLNYEEYVEVFTDIFISSEFQLAFDALTVIDNFSRIDDKKADICLIKLENSIEDVKDDKKPLTYELINIIKNLKENPAE